MKQTAYNKKEEIEKWPLPMNMNEGVSNHVVIHNNTPPNIKTPSFPKTTGEMLSYEVDISSEDKKPETKSKIYRDYHVILAKDSPKHNTNEVYSDESTYDNLNYVETDLCRDSGDTETESNSSMTPEKFIMEYEVATASSNAELYSNDSSSGDDEILIAAAVAANTLYLTSSSSIDSVYTGQESTDQCDSELSSADYWYCIKCKNRQNNPMFRYCEKCYQIRKTHFPPRPTKKKPRSARQRCLATQFKEPPTSSTTTDVGGNLSSPIYSRDNGNLNHKKDKYSHLKRKASNDGTINDNNRNGKQIRSKKCRISCRNLSKYSSGEEVDETSDLNSQKDSGFSSGHSSQELPGVTIKSTNSILTNILKKDQFDSDSSDTVTEELVDNEIVELSKEQIDSDTLTEELKETINGKLSVDKLTVTKLTNELNVMIDVNSISSSLDRHQSDLPQASLKNPQTLSQIVRSVSACSDAYTNTSNDADICLSPKVKVNGLGANNPENLENSQYGSCMTCLSEPKNGVFVHSRFLHLCCCYKCAVKIWNKNKKCPICNCAVKNVMKLFVH